MPSDIIPMFGQGEYQANVQRCVSVLRDGGLVVLPTETAYGVAGILSHAQARTRLVGLRGQTDQPFTVHLAHADDAGKYLTDVGEYGRRLMRKLWPGPVALIFDTPMARRQEVAKQSAVAESDLYNVTGAITLRCPKHAVFSDVVGALQGPVAMTLAGDAASGPRWSAKSLAAELGDRVDLIVDAGPTDYSKPSTILKVGADRYEVVRSGIWDERIIDRMLRTTLLFVCSGNTCRSPMAEAIARHLLAVRLGVAEKDLEKRGISVTSAGCFAMPGARATPQAIEAVRELGADLSAHRSRPISVELIHQADMIFAMGASHAAAVTALVPSAAEKVATLDPSGDVDDPIGGNIALYQELAGQLVVLIDKRLDERAFA